MMRKTALNVRSEKGETGITCNPLNFLARLKGFEPLTYGLEVRCSIQLSYRRIFRWTASNMTACRSHVR